jgi:hypothetical protein
MYPEHPGTIVFVDEERGTEDTREASGVPDTIKFVQVDGAWIPVMRVVAHKRDGRLVIRSYDGEGSLLSTTIQEPPR